MAKLKVHRAFDEFLLNPNLSLRAKGFLTMVLTNRYINQRTLYLLYGWY